MKPAPFVRHAPKTLEEALKILAEVAPQDGRVLAGGQSLVPIMAFRLAKPAHLVDINDVAGLDKIASDGKALAIGACVRHAAFQKPVTENPLGTLLSTVARNSSRGAPSAPSKISGGPRNSIPTVQRRGGALVWPSKPSDGMRRR